MVSFKKYQMTKILDRQKDNITNIHDLVGNGDPSLLFYFLADKLGFLLDNDIDVITKSGVEIRRKLHFIIEQLGPLFLRNPQVFENREFLKNPEKYDFNPQNAPQEKTVVLSKEPVIYVANHSFLDDTLATILAAPRHAYILFGSLPRFYNTLDGLTAYLNGVAMTNRKVKESRHVSTEKIIRAMEYGADALIFPEGVWNKTLEQLMIDLWSGIWMVAKETGAKIVPIVHYLRDHLDKSKTNKIHTVLDDPIKIDDLSQKAALDLIRDVLATWQYYMLELYGQSTREEELKGYNSPDEKWRDYLEKKSAEVKYYDDEIEHSAAYKTKDKILIEDVYENIANIENLTAENIRAVLDAKNIVLTRKKYNYQNLY